MKLAILADGNQKEEWLSKQPKDNVELILVSTRSQLLTARADAYFDLLFQRGTDSLESFSQLNAPLFINEVVHTFASLSQSPSKTRQEYKQPLLRLNAWPTFLKRDIVELAVSKKDDEDVALKIFNSLGWKCKIVPDIAGLITARVIAMVINEAYFTLEQEVSTKKEIDIAMKLGTNYPYGPFEWSKLIGLARVYQLLEEMSLADKKYQPCMLLKKETEQQLSWH